MSERVCWHYAKVRSVTGSRYCSHGEGVVVGRVLQWWCAGVLAGVLCRGVVRESGRGAVVGYAEGCHFQLNWADRCWAWRINLILSPAN